MTRPVSDQPRSWSWSYTFGLVSNTVVLVHDKTLCDMIVLKCNKHLCSLHTISTETVPNVFDVFCTKIFSITNMRVATEEFFFLLCILAVA